MSDLTVKPQNTSNVGANGSTSSAAPTPGSKPAPSTPATPSGVSDSVTLSLASQSTPPEEKPTLSEDDAQSQAAKLRQQLSSLNLSGTARQNQAIVALLRA
jgi:hypothetical protein